MYQAFHKSSKRHAQSCTGVEKTYPSQNISFARRIWKTCSTLLELLKAESRPTDKTMHMYITALSHFAVRMHQDRVCPEKLDNAAISRFVASLQNTQLYVCGPVRRFLSYLFEMKLTKTDLSIPLY